MLPVHLHLLDLITVYQYLLNHRSHHKVGHLPHYFSISKSVSLGFKSVLNTWASHTQTNVQAHARGYTIFLITSFMENLICVENLWNISTMFQFPVNFISCQTKFTLILLSIYYYWLTLLSPCFISHPFLMFNKSSAGRSTRSSELGE